MTSDKQQKLNNGCINIFRFLILLYEDKAYYDDVVNIYKNEIDEKTNNTIQVILNKAINALRVFGIKIVKNKNKYHLDSSLYALNYSLEDLKSISILINATENFPDNKAKESLEKLLKDLEIRMNNSTKNTLSNISNNYDFSFYYANLKDKINKCKDLCKTEMSFDITYLQNGEEIKTKGIAKDLLFDTKNAYLKMFDIKNKMPAEIPLSNILSLNPDPAKSKTPEAPTTVTFEVSGRLAKTYQLKENETLMEIKPNGNKIITNKDEPLDKLLSRLMRYFDCCQIVSPQSIKDKMKKLINESLSQYED